MRIRFDAAVPKDLRAIILPLLRRFAPKYLPTWCAELRVGFDIDDIEASAETSSRYEYRWARLSLKAEWFSYRDYRRDQTIIHELLHVRFGVLDDFVTELTALVGTGNKALGDRVEGEWRKLKEAVVEDFTETFCRIEGIVTDEEEDAA